jgi:hypothetical protein
MYNPSKKIVKPNNLRVLGERKPNDLKHDSQNPSTVEFVYNEQACNEIRLIAK